MNDCLDAPPLFVVTEAVAEVGEGHARTLATTRTTHHGAIKTPEQTYSVRERRGPVGSLRGLVTVVVLEGVTTFLFPLGVGGRPDRLVALQT